jgi:DNA-binding transcriptional ArsR family regulator
MVQDMSDSEEEIYSIMFSSLKHPARRKILRMLSDTPTSFSQMLEELGVSSSHLTYHLENLGELLSKTDDGKYKLSKFGEASVDTMRLVEETPAVRSKKRPFSPMNWKTTIAVFLITIIALSSVSVFQYSFLIQLSSDHDLLNSKYQQLLSWSADTDKAIAFIQDVIQIDITEYQVALLSNTVESRSDLGGVIEEILRYSLSNSEDKIDVVLRFRDQRLSRYQIYLFEGSPIYSEPQPYDLVVAAQGLIERYSSYRDSSYLEQMTDLLSLVDETINIEIVEDNMKLKISTSEDRTEFLWLYTLDGVDFSPKSLSFVFEDHALKQLTDGWFLFESGSTEVNISREEAITIARNSAKAFSWTFNDVVVSNFVILEEPVDVEFHPHPREDFLNLVPYWYVTLYLDKIYPGEVSRIAVGLWGDTGEVADITAVTV